MRLILLSTVVLGLALAAPAAAQSKRIEALNRAFAERVQKLPADQAKQARVILDSLKTDYADDAAEAFVPDSLALLVPAFRDGMAAFDDARYADAARLFEPLTASDDGFVAANAGYFYARSLVERGLLEEAEAFLEKSAADVKRVSGLTPYAGHFWFVKAYCQYSNLRFKGAAETLKTVLETFTDAPEPVLVGARQLKLEIERREIGTLDEVASLMGYAASRLKVADAKERTQKRQDEAVSLLDKMIEEEQKKEGQCSGCGQCQGGKASAKRRSQKPAEDSKATPAGEAPIGTLQPAERANPGERWGNLPPAEREKILQSLRDRFPTRYRELVEQYYRSLAEEK